MRCHHDNEPQFEEMQERLRQHLMKKMQNADVKGLELGSLIRILANYYSAVIHKKKVPGELSGPRMGILLRLLVEEEVGNPNGINPTTLSQFQKVKKNTISSLLRGLEESGYIERTPDPNDKRGYFIRISEEGHKKVDSVWPKRLKLMTDLSSDLTDEELDQLIFLLKKLQTSIQNHAEMEMPLVSDHHQDCNSRE